MYIALFLMVGCRLFITQGHSLFKHQNFATATTWAFPRGYFARFSKFCFNGPHQHHLCRLSLGSQWGAPTGHIGCMLKSPPATGRPGWRSGNARARCTGLRTSLDGCAAHPHVQSRVVLRPQQTAAECADGWCCEHHCHRAPPLGRVSRGRWPLLRWSAGTTTAHA